MIRLVWNYDIGEGTIKVDKEFTEGDDFVMQLDAIQDWVRELQDVYAERFKAHIANFEAIRAKRDKK